MLSPDEAIHTIALRCQIQIEVTRRRYTPDEQERLLDLFGQPDRWGQTLRKLALDTRQCRGARLFAGHGTVVDMQVPCTFDFNVAATKYFAGLADGEIPLIMLFSGTVFYVPPTVHCRSRPFRGSRKHDTGCRSNCGAK